MHAAVTRTLCIKNLLFCARFGMMPAPGIKLCAIAADHLFHSHAQVLTFILYISWMTWCHKLLHLKKVTSWRRLKKAHYASKPFWSFRNHNNIPAPTEQIMIILKWIWSSELKNYCKTLARQQVNKIHSLIIYIWFCNQNEKMIFLKV